MPPSFFKPIHGRLRSDNGVAKEHLTVTPDTERRERTQRAPPSIAVPTRQCPGVIKVIMTFAQVVVTSATLGGSITFTVIPTVTKPPHPSYASEQDTRNYLSLAWLLFMLGLYFGASALMFMDYTVAYVHGTALYVVLLVWILTLQLCVALPFIFLSLAVRAFAPAVGTVALGLTGLVMVVALVVWSSLILFHDKIFGDLNGIDAAEKEERSRIGDSAGAEAGPQAESAAESYTVPEMGCKSGHGLAEGAEVMFGVEETAETSTRSTGFAGL